MKALNIFFVILFVAAAALQYNDPDPLTWIVLYLYGAVLCFMALRGKYLPVLYWAGLGVYLIYGLYLFFDEHGVISWVRDHQAENIVQSMKATKPWIEETREFFGLLLLVIALVVNMAWLRRRQKPVAG
ncbi:transmembrane 220 family protein [Botryobacter ruber]|uniref:transmembrane 220 family protein n=1 Tax=Botryobacter ruber TaxID=2171629 RepID=UPI000E0A5C7B|nr:transmembrane 220 family protein [Botryobacter ruber]